MAMATSSYSSISAHLCPARKRRSAPAASTHLDAHPVVEVKAGVFKDTCLQLLDQVHDHAMELAITKRGTVVAHVVPRRTRVPSAFGFMRGTVVAHDDIVSPDVDAWGDLG